MLPHIGTISKQKLLQVEEKKQTNKERKKERKKETLETSFHIDDVRGRSFSVLAKFTQFQMVSSASQSVGCSLSPTLTSVAAGYT